MRAFRSGVVRPTTRATTIALLAIVAGVACSDSSPTVAVDPQVRIARGHDAFLASCASCHTSRDAYDLAFFGFADSTIVRRARKHVSAETGRDIAAYVRSLNVTSRGITFRPFQPTASTTESDGAFWQRLFNVQEDQWPAGLTAATIRAIDMRTIVAPLPMLVWSDETDDDDWMPDVPLDPNVLDGGGGALRRLIDAYYAAPSDATLLDAINTFRDIVRPATGGTDRLCYGETGAQPRAPDCFQAMRWMASLAAVHFLRRGRTEDIPLDVVKLWWETGEAAVSSIFVPRGIRPTIARTRRTAGWLYLAFTYAPMQFREENSYLGQFVQSSGFSRLAMLLELRRMVGTGGVHDRAPDAPFWDAQVFWDGALAVTRAPNVFTGQAALFVLDYLVGVLDGGATFRPESQNLMSSSLGLIDMEVSRVTTIDAATRSQIAARRAALVSRIPAALR